MPPRGPLRRGLSSLCQRDGQRLSVDRDRAAEAHDESNRDCGTEIAQILTKHDRRGGGRDAREPDLEAVHFHLDFVEPTMAKRRLEQRRQPALDGVHVRLNRGPVTCHPHALLAKSRGGRLRELERVGLPRCRVVAAGLDPRREGQLLDQLCELCRRCVDHLDVAVRGRLEIPATHEGRRKAVHSRERRAQIVAGERYEPGEVAVVGQGGFNLAGMERTETPDLQAAAPEVALGLSSVGVTGVQKAVRIGRGRSEKLISATIDCTVDLDPRQKGVHMSRFPELFEEAVESVVDDDAFLVEDLAEHVARRVVNRQEALLAEVRIAARYPYERRTPVTKLATQEMVSLIGIAAASRERVRRVVGVEATGINACPCAQGLVRGAAADRLLEAGFEDSDVERILELVPLATHNQRGRGTLLVGTAERLNAERLVEIVEGSMSSPIYELLKRPDELFVVEHAHLQPRFVEDSVRVALKSVLDELPHLGDGDFVFSRQVNFETIHAHEVVAERHGTIGELRSELDGGGHGPAAHTVLRDWLRA